MSTPIPIESLDLSSRRSVDVVSLDENRAVVRYFYHAGKFWNAVIPLDGVQAILGQAFNFSTTKKRKTKDGYEVIRNERGLPKPRFGFINHVQSRFQLKDGFKVQLFETEDVSKTPDAEIDDFVYSIEAVGRPGDLFDFRNGMLGKLMCAHRFLSTEEMVFERVVILGYYVRESPRLPLSDDEMRNILIRSLQRSDRAGLTETYYLYRCCATNNCTSNPFQIIDQSVNYTWRQKLGSLVYRLPLNPRFYLRIRGLDSDPSHFHLVRNEFGSFIESSETKARKRAVVRAEIRKRREAKDRKA